MIFIQQWTMRCQWSSDFMLPSTIHVTLSDVRSYIQAHWDKMPDDVPEDYAAPMGDPVAIPVDAVDPELLAKLRASKFGIEIPRSK